jgi:hypothetical protein
LRRDIVKTILEISGEYSLVLVLGLGLSLAIGCTHAEARMITDIPDEITLQTDPDTEQMNQVSEPVGDISEEPEFEPTEPLDEDTDNRASEDAEDDIGTTESVDEDSETDDQASQEVGQDAETAKPATEMLPPGPESEEYPLQNQAPPQEEMPLDDREAEGRRFGQ